MVFHWPQITMVVWLAIALGVDLRDHGSPKTGKDNFFISLVVASIYMTLLYFGGFFNGTSP